MASSTASTTSLVTPLVGVLILAVSPCVTSSPVVVSPPYVFGDEPPTPNVLTESYGYATEVHEVESSGYILTLFRLKGPRKDDGDGMMSLDELYAQNHTQLGSDKAKDDVVPAGPPEPFILQHGLASNAAQWVMFGPEHSLAYTLADEGFDVWLASGRGSKYGKRHRQHKPDSEAFWDFSWHEQGAEDLPAIIDYVLNATRHRQVWYAGHSMGTTIMFVMNALLPQYDAKVKHHFALAPTAFLGRVKNHVVLDFTRRLDDSVQLWKNLGISHFSTETPLMSTTRMLLCAVMKEACKQTFFYDIFKVDETQEFENQAEITGVYLPGDFSTKQIIHFAQHVLAKGKFRRFDHGSASNMEIYNTSRPPEYDMSKVNVPMTFIYAESDDLTTPEDVVAFSKRFNASVPRMHLVPLKQFNHADFISAQEQRKYVHEPILEYVKEIRRESGFIPVDAPSQPKPKGSEKSYEQKVTTTKSEAPSPNKVRAYAKRLKIYE